MYLFFDTETSGLPQSHDAPASEVENWPRLVQIAWMLTDEDGNELRNQSFIIRKDGFQIPTSATKVHGITTETARRLGIEIASALAAFDKDLSAAEILVAHNIQFDERVVSAEFHRTGRITSPLEGKTLYCTMRSSTDFCRLPGGPAATNGQHSNNFIKGFLDLLSSQHITPLQTSMPARSAFLNSSARALFLETNLLTLTLTMKGQTMIRNSLTRSTS